MRPYRLLLALLAIAMALPSHLALARPVAIVGNLRAGTVTVVDEQALKTLGTIDVTPDGKTPRDPAQAAIYPVIVKSKGVNYVQGLALSPDGKDLVRLAWLSRRRRGIRRGVAAAAVAARGERHPGRPHRAVSGWPPPVR